MRGHMFISFSSKEISQSERHIRQEHEPAQTTQRGDHERRAHAVRIFPSPQSCLRLVRAP